MSGPTLKGMHLPDDVVADGIDWRCTENGKASTSAGERVRQEGKAQDRPADKASMAGLSMAGKVRVKPKHQARVARRKLKYALPSARRK